jgi:hypothetical protein
MTILARLERWKEEGVISPPQHDLLAGLSRGDPFSVFLELNILLYAGVLIFIGGLGWTVSTWSQQLGELLVLIPLTAILAGCFWYCFARAPAWSPQETPSPSLVFDYVLYLGCLTWLVELSYLETRFHLLSGQGDLYILGTAGLFFFLAYRLDNRFVLSLALSSLAAWFGLTISHWPSHQDDVYRQYAIIYSLSIGAAGFLLERRGLKPHFLSSYLNIAANVLFWAIVSGVVNQEGYGLWLLALLAACAASLVWGLIRRQLSFVAYAAVYGYIGVSAILIRQIHGFTAALVYFLLTGTAMLVALVWIARRFGKEA